MAKRLRHRAHNIDWTPEPIKPELLHFFRLPSISSLSHPYDNNDSDVLRPAEPPFETVSDDSIPIRIPRPSLTIRNPSDREMVLAAIYPRSRKAPAFCHPDRRPPLPSNAGTPSDRKQPGAALLFHCKIPRCAKRRRVFDDPRSKRIGWVSSGGVVPWAMAAHASLSKRSVLVRGKKTHSSNAAVAEGSMGSQICGKRKFSVSLLSKEIEEDFMSITGEMPAPRLNKRHRETQSQLDNLFPGMCFVEPEKCLACNSA